MTVKSVLCAWLLNSEVFWTSKPGEQSREGEPLKGDG